MDASLPNEHCSLTDGEHFFIDAETKLHKVAPADWKERSKKGHRQLATFVTYFRVKFYVGDMTLMRSVHCCRASCGLRGCKNRAHSVS